MPKVTILAEKYATDYEWYDDVILNPIRMVGADVSEEAWYRVIQSVINHDDVQDYGAQDYGTDGLAYTNPGHSALGLDIRDIRLCQPSRGREGKIEKPRDAALRAGTRPGAPMVNSAPEGHLVPTIKAPGQSLGSTDQTHTCSGL